MRLWAVCPGPVERGWSLTIAQRHAWSLARTLMVCVTLFHAGNGYAAVPTSEFDGDADSVVREYDPFNP
ncbi:MAG: hypothetical protein J0M19_03435 [Sphingomonadales bacterium]|nr:hypothetical protein [Sphingomonadales bacterium]